MARNKVQFQKGLSEDGFDALYGTEEQCHAKLASLRWRNGFECPGCGRQRYCIVKRGESGNRFRFQQGFAAALVQGQPSPDSIEERNIRGGRAKRGDVNIGTRTYGSPVSDLDYRGAID